MKLNTLEPVQLELPFNLVVNDYGEYAPQPTFIERLKKDPASEMNTFIEDESECA
jgi:hypothetical protein